MTKKRTLIVTRHAKSSWDLEGVSDIDRPLKHRGIRAAYEMARRLNIEQHIPELIITSPANRALHTAMIFMRVFELELQKIKIDDRLYGKGIIGIERVLNEQSVDLTRIMIVGHNPEFSDLASKFSGNSYIELPTCGICQLMFETESWGDIFNNQCVESYVDFPKKGVES